jgi:Protein of unknown function (DUF1565)
MKTQAPFIAFLLVMLVACSDPSLALVPPAPNFTLRLEPPVLNARVTEHHEVRVIVARSGGFAEPIVVGFGGEHAGLEAAPLRIVGNEGVLAFRISDAAKIGTNSQAVVGTSGNIVRNETLTLRVAKAIASVSSLTVQGGANQVRQGVGAVTLNVMGSNLERVTGATLGDLKTTIGRSTTSTLEVGAVVPHGAVVGTKDLVLLTDGGSTVVPTALIVSNITSSPKGNDNTGLGTSEQPYRSLSKALSVSERGDTVQLQNGSYNVLNGETKPNGSPNVPDGVHIVGESLAGTWLEGLDQTDDGLVFAGDAWVTNLSVGGYRNGIVSSAGVVNLENVLLVNNQVGFQAAGGTAKLKNTEVKSSSLDGVLVYGTATLEIVGGRIHDNQRYGCLVSQSARFKAAGLEVDNNTRSLGIEGIDQSEINLDGVNVHHNGGGLRFGGKNFKMRNSSVHDNDIGFTLQGMPQRIDLGTFVEAGNNALYNNDFMLFAQIFDVRQYPATNQVVFTVSATTLNGFLPKADVYSGLYDKMPYFYISEGNTIQFF